MKKLLGIRREDKNIWERRVPIIPEHIKILKDDHGIETIIQPFEKRAFSDKEFKDVGATVNEDLSECPVVIAVKEIPIKLLQEDKTYMFFSHTIKGQEYNMPLLKRIMDLKCTLIDYELITNNSGRRVVFFGKYAGIAGMIDALHGYGKRLKELGYSTPLLEIKPAYEYHSVEDAKTHIAKVGKDIEEQGLPAHKAPYVIGFMGYGNVSNGAQEIFDLLPHKEILPEELNSIDGDSKDFFYKVVFKEEHLVEPKDPSNSFVLQDYFDNPGKYKSKFEEYLPYLSLIVNAIYWTEESPRFLTKKYFKSIDEVKLDVVCDITCDIDGAVEFTVKSTESDNPAYVYNPNDDSITDGYSGEGIVNIAVDNLPTELPRNSSIEFSNALNHFIPGIVNADKSKNFDDVNFPPEIKKAVIVYKGELTEDFKYLNEFIK
ncbi:MAG: bifunctional lysine ketoglutarate reductase /saccharopine dehydrogenase family protein [Bacteroidota bacterium]